MIAFNLPFGGGDPRSLPALLRQQMAPGLIPGPVPPVQLTPGFRPPALGMGLPSPPPPDPGFNVKDGAGMLSAGLAGFRKPGFDPRDPGAAYGRTKGDADLNGYNRSPAMVDVGNGVMLPNPNAQSGVLTQPDFLTGAWRSTLGFFGSGAGDAAGGLVGGAGAFFP